MKDNEDTEQGNNHRDGLERMDWDFKISSIL